MSEKKSIRPAEKSKQSEKEKYMELQMIEQQMKQLQKYMETFEQQLLEIRTLIESLNEFSNLKKGDKIHAPIANGVFVKASLEDSKEVLINVGNNVIVPKSIPDAIKLLQSQEAEIERYRQETVSNLEALMHRVEEVNQ